MGGSECVPQFGVGPVEREAVLQFFDGHFIVIGIFIVDGERDQASAVGMPNVGVVGELVGRLEDFILCFDEEIQTGGRSS